MNGYRCNEHCTHNYIKIERKQNDKEINENWECRSMCLRDVLVKLVPVVLVVFANNRQKQAVEAVFDERTMAEEEEEADG